jgi:hypothetical protein
MFASNQIFFNSLYPGKVTGEIDLLPFRRLSATRTPSNVLFIRCFTTFVLCIALICPCHSISTGDSMIELNSESSDELSKPIGRFTRILQQVCQTTEWEYGEVWLPKTDNPILELSSVWYVSAQLNEDRQLAWKQFRYCSEKFILRIGEGLPGRVWASQTTEWITDVTEWITDVSAQSEFYFLRNQIAKAFGVRASFGLPINMNDMQAIVAFFKSEAQNQNSQLMAATEAIVKQSR